MSENIIHFPKLNPIHFRKVNSGRLSKYYSKPFEDYRFHETQQPWENPSIYFQKFTLDDITKLQFTSNFSSQELRVVDCLGSIHSAYTPTQIRQNKSMPGYWVYETPIAWGTVPANKIYFVQVFLGDVLQLVSEPIYVTATAPGTILLTYSHPRYHGGILFETGWVGELRVEGYIGRLLPGSQSEVFTTYDEEIIPLSSTPYQSYTQFMGNERGVPDWMVEKFNWIYSCRNTYTDGIQYSKDGEFEFSESEQHPMRGVRLKIRPGVNNSSLMVNPVLDAELQVNVVSIGVDVFGVVPIGSDDTIVVVTANE